MERDETKPRVFLRRKVRSLATRVFQFASNGSVAWKIRDCRDLPRTRATTSLVGIVTAHEPILVSISKRIEAGIRLSKSTYNFIHISRDIRDDKYSCSAEIDDCLFFVLELYRDVDLYFVAFVA